MIRGSNGPKRKHGNVVEVVDGDRFDSKLELAEWRKLQLLQLAGEIRGLRHHVKFSLFCNGGEHLQNYTADFVYEEKTGDGWDRVVADAKSEHTRNLRTWSKIRTLMRACHNIEVRELR